jgi:hypothetical protein
MKDMDKEVEEKKVQQLAEEKKPDQKNIKGDWLKDSIKTKNDLGKKITEDFHKIFLAQVSSTPITNQ